MDFVRKITPFLFLTGCMVGPNYETPKVSSPKNYSEGPGFTKKDLSKWWKTFNDPILDKLIEEGLAQNLDIKVAIEKIEEMKKLYRIQVTKLYPEIDVKAQYDRNKFPLVQKIPSGVLQNNLYVGSLETSWELDFFGKIRRGNEAAWYDFESSLESKRLAEVLLIAEIANTYLELLTSHKKERLIALQIKCQKQLLAFNKNLEKCGLSSDIAVEQSESMLQQLNRELPFSVIEQKQAFHRLAVLLGKNPTYVEEQIRTIPDLPKIPSIWGVGLPSELLKSRPDIRKAERELAYATAKIGEATADLFPSFSLTGAFGYLSGNFNNWFSSNNQGYYIGPKLFWPFIDFGKRRAQVKVKNAEQRQALYTYENTVLKAFEEVENALVSFYQDENKLHSSEKELLADKKTLRWKKDLFLNGLQNYLTVLETQKTVLETLKVLLSAQKDELSSYVFLYKALGGGWID